MSPTKLLIVLAAIAAAVYVYITWRRNQVDRAERAAAAAKKKAAPPMRVETARLCPVCQTYVTTGAACDQPKCPQKAGNAEPFIDVSP